MLIGELAYDAFSEKRNITNVKFYISTLILFALVVVIGGVCGDSVSVRSFGGTILILGVVICIRFINGKNRCAFKILMYVVLTVELLLNFNYAFSTYSTKDLKVAYGDITSAQKEYQMLDTSNGVKRSINLKNQNSTSNYGEYYNISSTGAFNSYVNNNQMNTHQIFGYGSGKNYLSSNYVSSLTANSFANIKYIQMPFYSETAFKNISQYKYLGKINSYYVFENQYAGSLGYFVDDRNIKEVKVQDTEYQDMLDVLFSDDEHKLSCDQSVTLGNRNNGFQYVDENGNELKLSDVVKHNNMNDSSTRVKMVINFTAEADGEAYIYCDQMVYLGKVVKGKKYTFTINDPRNMYHYKDNCVISVRNIETEKEMIKKAQNSEWNDIDIQNDRIRGRINCPGDGVTVFSLAFSRDWKAYVDGKEVKVQCLKNSIVYIRTSKGEHTVTLQYSPYHYSVYKGISFGCFGLVILVYILSIIYKKSKKGRAWHLIRSVER